MNDNRLEAIEEYAKNVGIAAMDTARALDVAKRRLDKAENRIALLEMTLKATVEVMLKLQAYIEQEKSHDQTD